MSYYIIGGDGKQYGPIGEDDLRRWIAEGRLNAQSQAKPESDAEFRPLSALPEFADVFPQAPPQSAAPPAFAISAALPDGDYNLPIGGCISAGWQLVKSNFWPSVGVSFLFAVITTVFNQLGGLFTRPLIQQMVRDHRVSASGVLIIGSTSLLSGIIYSVLMAGLFVYFLKLIRGQSASVGDLFAGFGPVLGQLILLGLVQFVLVMVGLALCVIPGIYLSVSWLFAIPLVIDRQMGFWDAMELSRKRVGKHWFVVFGFMIVYCLVVLAGALACCVGIFVTIPIGIAALMYGYESIFSQTQSR